MSTNDFFRIDDNDNVFVVKQNKIFSKVIKLKFVSTYAALIITDKKMLSNIKKKEINVAKNKNEIIEKYTDNNCVSHMIIVFALSYTVHHASG